MEGAEAGAGEAQRRLDSTPGAAGAPTGPSRVGGTPGSTSGRSHTSSGFHSHPNAALPRSSPVCSSVKSNILLPAPLAKTLQEDATLLSIHSGFDPPCVLPSKRSQSLTLSLALPCTPHLSPAISWGAVMARHWSPASHLPHSYMAARRAEPHPSSKSSGGHMAFRARGLEGSLATEAPPPDLLSAGSLVPSSLAHSAPAVLPTCLPRLPQGLCTCPASAWAAEEPRGLKHKNLTRPVTVADSCLLCDPLPFLFGYTVPRKC